MSWFNELLVGGSVGHTIFVFAFVIVLGILLGKIKIFGVSLGMTFVLFVGIAVSHFGTQYTITPNHQFMNHDVLHFVKEFGLILFVYAVGLQAGPSFIATFKTGGLKLNLFAVSIVLLGVLMTVFLHYVTNIDMPTMVGILSGAITNTPGLGAAQQAYAGLDANNNINIISTAYAMSYPLGVIGIIFSIIFIRIIFQIDMNREANKDKETQVTSKLASNDIKLVEDKHVDEPHLIPIFIGIFLGVVLGSIPVVIPGVPQPVRLGLAGGPLVMAILLSAIGPKINFPTKITKSATLMLREVGICLFLACVGLSAGENFVSTIVGGDGLFWVGLGVLITVVPLLTVGIVAYKVFKVDYFVLMGMIAGSTTDPPALSYSANTTNSDKPLSAYAAVYPLTMFLRIMTAQLLILLFT